MKKKSLLIMLLVALFVPLALNAQTKKLKNSFVGVAKAETKTQNVTFKKSPVQIPNLETRMFQTKSSSNATIGRGTRDAQYELVTSSQSDWSGNYVFAVPFDVDFGYAFDGVIDDNTGGFAEVTLENTTTITSIGDAAVLTIAPSTIDNSYYSIKINGGDYLMDGNSGLETSSTESDYTTWAIELTSDGVQIYNPIWSGGPYNLYFLLFQNTSSGGYGAFWLTDDGTSYSSETVPGYEFTYILPYLYKDTSSGESTDCNSVTFSSLYNTNTNLNGVSIPIGDDSSVTFSRGSSNTNPQYYTNGTAVRAYARNTFTVTSTSNIVSINIAFGTGGNNNAITANTGTYTDGTWTGSATSVTFTIGGTNGHRRIAGIEVCLEGNSCPVPTNLSASNVTTNGATLNWRGEADSYNIRYRIPAGDGEPTLFQDFESGGFDNWTTVRNGGGTTNTDWRVINPETAFQSGGSPAHSGSYVAMSRSWASSAYNVDNWLISPQFTLGGTLKYWVMDDGQYHETYYICVSTGGNSVREFTQIHAPGNATGNWTQVTVDLRAYEGRQGYIAFHHTDYDQDYLFIDDIAVYGEPEPAGPWVTVNNVTSPYDITGLQSETTYEWQVMSNCGDEESDWSASSTFTTLSVCDILPTELNSTEITNSSATLSWTGLADTYDLQYREYDATAPATIIFTAEDVWGDGSGYQMLLDADATAYGTTIPDVGPLTTSGDASASVYAEFEYKIPVNADGSLTTSNIVTDGNTVTIEIPAGTYDWCITNPTPGDRMWIAGEAGNVGGRQDDYVFEAGKTYEFYVYMSGTGDATDVTITSDAEIVNNVTSPYQLTGLNPGTTYEWQIKAAECDNWSASAYFTTINGTLVESITADDVIVTIDETASITNLEVLPADATNPAVTYTSNDETIATVDAEGVVTGVGVGETTITIAAIDGSGVSYDINVTVNGIDVTEITAEDVTVVTSETATISYTVDPENATDPSVTFTSADETIATVDAEGVVTGVGVGETTITIASVSNPDVTAEITVTVTSNPNAVQFTVNAPATVQPGDVITVEGVLTGPSNGTWDGFTNLVMGIYYEATAFEYVANSLTYGPVAQQAQQLNSMFMPNTDNPGSVILGINCYNFGSFVTAEGVVFSAQFTVLAETGEYEFTAQPNFYYNFDHEGAFITYEAVPSTVAIAVSQAFVLEIDAYESDKDNYYLIASPVGNVTANLVEGLQTPDFDFYSFDQSAELEWINHRDETEYELESGVGYLYANNTGTDLTFRGIPTTEETVTVALTYVDAADGLDFPDWNLVGNPFEVTATLDQPFYAMENGAFVPKDATDELPAMNGAFVVGSADVTSVTFTKNAGNKTSKLALNLTNSGKLIDRAIVSFKQGQQLPKLQLFKNNARVYIEQDNKDFAVVNANEMGEMPVSFKAESNGIYTISFTNEEVEFSYLHLIDNLTGNDVDLLVNPSYSFEAKTTDYASRFKLVFATGNANIDEFAYYADGTLVINNEGNATMNVYDVTGRLINTQNVNGSCQVNINTTTGVYMIQLVNGENTKTQKIVVK